MADVAMGDSVATRLELVQALRLSTTPVARKLELVMSFIESSKGNEEDDAGGREMKSASAWIKMPQVIGFLSEWVQTALIKSCKPGASASHSGEQSDVPAHLDSRYWSILKFCLLSGYLHHITGVSPSLMRPLTSCISVSLSETLKLELIEVVSVLFREYSRPFRSNLDSWVSLTCEALNLLRPDGRNVSEKDPSDVELVSGIVEGFSRTIASHPNPSKVFQSVVARLLEPLLVVIGDSISNDNQSLLRVVRAAEEIIENGVFHPSHVGGFHEVCIFLKGNVGDTNSNGKKNSEARQRSYHRTFFQKLDELRKAGNFLMLIGLGRTFKIYATRWKAQQVALSEDVYGVRGQGKLQLSDNIPGDKAEKSGEAKSGEKSGQEIESEKVEENVASQPRKHANQTDVLFTVFAELLGPLNLELSTLIGSENNEAAKIEQTEEHVTQVSLLMLGANELLAAAKEAEAYKSIEDTLSLTYFNFLQEVYNLTIKIGMEAFDLWSNGDPVIPVSKKKRRSLGAETRINSKKKTEAVFSEVVFALQHLLELEYRVFEQQLSSIWIFMFKMVAPAIEVKRTILKALEFCCGLINMYSDLRQVEIPIFYLTDTLADLQTSSQLDVLSDAVEKIICSKQYLITLGSVMHKLPEGQVANLLKALKSAVAKTLDLLDSQHATSLSQTSKFQGSMKGVLEVYTCILENANVTSSNSVLAGGAIRELLMKVLAPFMTDLVDAITQNEFSIATKSLFLLSVYMSSRILHRQCLSLMPPKAARKASTAILDVEIDPLTADETEVITYLEASGFLMSLQRGSVKMSKFLTKLFQRSSTEGGMHSPAMIYTVNSIAIQSLVDLDRRVWALKFLTSKAESNKKYMKVLRSLKKEGAKLVSIILGNLIPIENEETSVTSVKWNRVMTTADSNTIYIARWRLICETVDVWSAFANEEHLQNFVMVLLRTGKGCASKGAKKRHYSGEEAGSMGVEEYREMDLHVITEEILTNLDFFEIEGIRKVFSSAFLEELKKTLLSSFKEDCPIFRVVDDCIQGITPPSAADSDAMFVEKVKLKLESIYKLSSSTGKGLILSEEQQKTFSDCSCLLNLLSSLPCGYLPPVDNARCAHTICQLEIFLVDFLLDDKAVQLRVPSPVGKSINLSSDGSRLVWADAIIACRHALDFLANSSATSEPGIVSSDFTRTLFGNSTSTQCVTLLPEIVAMRTLQTFTGRDDEISQGLLSVPPELDTSSLFYTLLSETCAVIEASLANICSAEAKMLVTPKASLDMATGVERKSAKKKAKKLKGALSALGTILVTEAQNVEKVLETEQRPRWHRHVSTIAAISSTLWSMTAALERVDKECRNSVSASLIWRTELPDAWVYIVKELEPILVSILVKVLFPMGVSGLEFFSKLCTKASEVHDIGDQDSIEEDKFDGDESKSFQDEDLLKEASDTSSDEESEEEDADVHDVLDIDDHDTEAVKMDQSFQSLKASVIEESSSLQFASLHSVLEGNVREKSEFVGELYMAVAAIVKLRSLFYSPFSSATVVLESTDVISFKNQSPQSLDILLLASYRLLLGSVQLIHTKKLIHPGWLVGIIKYMGSVGSYLPCMKPFILPIDFVKLVNLHLELIGALVVLKENSVTNTDDSLEVTTLGTMQTSDWNLDTHDVGALETRSSRNAGTSDQTDDLLFITQSSFESLLKYAPRQHMVLALQSVEKAVAGVWGGPDQGLGFENEKSRGGQVGPVVAAGVDCLGLALQAVSGKMRLHLLASHCPAFYGGLHNLIAHCQGPSIFLERQPILVSGSERLSSKVNGAPVVLRGLEILTTLAARAVIFPMKACSVAMALQCPGMLFRSFYDVGKAKALLQNASWKHGFQNLKVTTRVSALPGFNETSVKLYVACCRLLCALLRHRIRECGHSMALLGESCRVLLHCLTAPSLTDAADASVASIVAGAAQCGSWLSRVYQEMETHKETMGKYCCHLLADYLNVISGQSLGGVGLKREVDSALRPGAFALLDACSGNDLQQLHAALGEGARRSALMTLRHDYDLHYKYTGKV
ncbi:hypothetical protein KC19_8G179700 [Ceratodon purpureus]|uniref:Nucleolar 27S pre-rRNA processing Urb2/Npa2 C-terminal domain-containing protein n=1 Tax=Ceratodon purpureus TaxID=3225 RepID=A0A8T0H886_CERPU|nr:hypothetical protein KC19_8G179700 [Ceratodon purpureus]